MTKYIPLHILVWLATILCPLLSYADDVDAVSAAATPEFQVSLLTAAPGREVYQLEGHSAIRIKSVGNDVKIGETLNQPIDVVINWGVFDFNSPNFLYRFVSGETDYLCVEMPTEWFLAEYRESGRRVTEQVLDLTPEQTHKIIELAATNLQPENSTYRYNYVKDNCATRPLSIIEQSIGREIDAPTLCDSTKHTFRSEMIRYHNNYPWYQFGIDLALGSGIDYKLSTHERAFAPVFLQQILAQSGLVKETNILTPGSVNGVIESPTPFYLTPRAVAIYLMVITLSITIADCRRKKLSRWFDSILFGTIFITGCVLTFLIFVSTHEATSPNWLYLWLNPLSIIPAIGVWIKKCKRVVYWYQICNFALLILLLAGQHFFGQVLNWAFPLFILCDMMRSAAYIYIYRTDKHER